MSRIDNCIKMARIILKDTIGEANPTEADLSTAVEQASFFMKMSEEEKKQVVKGLQYSLGVILDLGNGVVDSATFHPWVNSRKATMDTYYWDRYQSYLELDMSWAPQVVSKLGQVSDEILDLCGNPEEKGTWRRKGLIIGDIQSGKTSNYLALCNKAADAGYHVIILLTGTIESLRRQTQERVDSGFVGLNSRNTLRKNAEKNYIGVGQIDSNRTAASFTTVTSDFNMHVLESNNFTLRTFTEPVIFVLKKQRNVLENLATWLKNKNTLQTTDSKVNDALLLIDDEADNASINTKKAEQERTAINEGIIKILKLFSRSTYIGVTATPYANIFIDAELDDQKNDEFNLFPSDFIYNLSAPSNYIGSEKIFDADGDYKNSIQEIKDVAVGNDGKTTVFRSKAKSAHIVGDLPQSLIDAINYFMLFNVAQDLRGRNLSHRSMLVNVTQFDNVQIQVFDLINLYLSTMQRKVKNYSKMGREEAEKHEEILCLKDSWFRYKLDELTGFDWETVLDNLNESIAPIQLRLVNYKTKSGGYKTLDYTEYNSTGLRVIAIGGNALSRGLTLEGLAVSYFVRNSQMYDTLLQMGRWFGYRQGYENLFKIWMEPETIERYRYITMATNELKDSIQEMRRLGLTPRDFGLKVQQNKVSLFVTARNKRYATTEIEQWISLAAEVVETPRLIANFDTCIKHNVEITTRLLDYLGDNRKEYYDQSLNFGNNRIVYSNISNETVAAYISDFAAHPKHLPFNAKDLSDHIMEHPEKWTVVVMGGSSPETLEEQYFSKEIADLGIHYSYRKILRDGNSLLISGERTRVGAPGATRFGLTQERIKEISDDYKKQNPEKKTVPDKPYLRVERQPVLLIYPIKIDFTEQDHPSDDESKKLIGNYPIIGLTLGFPGNDMDNKSRRVRYILNRVADRAMMQFDFDFDGDEDDD